MASTFRAYARGIKNAIEPDSSELLLLPRFHKTDAKKKKMTTPDTVPNAAKMRKR
jgi:hypothetical protein